VGSLRFQGRFHGTSNLSAWEIQVKHASPEGFSCRLGLSHFMHPWILCRHRILQFELWVPKVCFLAKALLSGALLCWILLAARTSVNILCRLEARLLLSWLVEICFSVPYWIWHGLDHCGNVSFWWNVTSIILVALIRLPLCLRGPVCWWLIWVWHVASRCSWGSCVSLIPCFGLLWSYCF
jgi:hypothetical protein